MDNHFQTLRPSGFATSIQNLNPNPVGKSKSKSYEKLNHIPVYIYAPENLEVGLVLVVEALEGVSGVYIALWLGLIVDR